MISTKYIITFILAFLVVNCKSQNLKMQNKKQFIHASENGNIVLNGNVPEDFNIPTNHENYTVNFLGTIYKEKIEWLPFDKLNLFSPEFLQGTLFIDYSNPNNPKYLNDSVIQKINYPDKSSPFEIKEYDKVKVDIYSKYQYSKDWFGYLNVPAWLQDDETPISPITGAKMKFLIQLSFEEFDLPKYKQSNYFKYPPYIYLY